MTSVTCKPLATANFGIRFADKLLAHVVHTVNVFDSWPRGLKITSSHCG